MGSGGARRPATAVYAAVAVLDAALAARGPTARPVRRVTKPLLMPVLHLATRPRARRRAVARATAVAQLLSWAGDLALLGEGRTPFLAGVGSFAGAHVGYVAAFRSVRDPAASWREPGPVAAAGTWVLLAPALAAAAGRDDPELRLPVAGYAGIICTMVAASTVLDRHLPRRTRGEIVAGTALFLLSDSLIGVQRFLRRAPSPLLEGAVMATYTAGQWCIADGLRRVADAEPGRGIEPRTFALQERRSAN